MGGSEPACVGVDVPLLMTMILLVIELWRLKKQEQTQMVIHRSKSQHLRQSAIPLRIYTNNGASVGEAVKNRNGRYMKYSLVPMRDAWSHPRREQSNSYLCFFLYFGSLCLQQGQKSVQGSVSWLVVCEIRKQKNTNVFILWDLNGVKASSVLLVRLNTLWQQCLSRRTVDSVLSLQHTCIVLVRNIFYNPLTNTFQTCKLDK